MTGQYDDHIHAYRLDVFVRSFPPPEIIEVGPGVYRLFLEALHASN